jgi:transcriptional regulator with XRE-family HTH domain
MASAREELPAVARRRVRLALRAARDHAGLSQSEVAQRLGWSLSKLQRIELGEVTVTPTDLRAVLGLYGTTDEKRISALTDDTRAARRERYWTEQEHRDHLPAGLLQLMQFELRATVVRDYQIALMPGVLQTAASAEAHLGWFDESLTEDQRRVRREVRLSRRRDVIERDGAPEYRVLLDESVLWRAVGGELSAADQFDDLAHTAERPNVHVRVLPMDVGTMMSASGAFMVLDLSDDPQDAVLYQEGYLWDQLVQDLDQVGYHRAIFEQFWRKALDEDASHALILARAYDLRARIARASSANADK